MTIAMKKTLFITMLAAALLGGNVFANTGFEGGIMLGSTNVLSENGNLVIFEDAQSQYTELGDVYGSFQDSPVSTNATVTIHGGIVQGAYGAFSLSDVAEGKVKMTGGIVLFDVYGGCATDESCNATKNTVIVSGGSVGRTIYGGYVGGESLTGVSSNRVYITGLSAGCAPNVIGGLAAAIGEASAGGNQVHLVGDGAQILIDNELYQGHAVTLGKVMGGQANGYVMGNSIDIYGSGISAKSVQYLQSLNFHLVDGLATAEAPMLTLSSSETVHALNMANFSLGIIADDVTDWGVLAGRTVTLAETQVAIQGFGESSYKLVNVSKGEQADAAKALLTLGNEGKELLLTVLRPGTELLAPGESRQAGHATITALAQTEPGLLDNLTLGTDTISGQGRSDSSAGGLKIDSTADLLMEGLTLTANNRISVGAHTLTLKEVSVEGDWTVAAGSRLNLRENSTITGGVTLEGGSTLDLGGATHSGNVSLGWNTAIGNGSVNGNITFAAGNQQVSLCGNLGGTGNISIGVVNSTSPVPHPVYTSTLNLGGHTLTKGLKLVGDTTVSNGKLVLAHDMTWSLYDIQARTVTIGADTTVDLNEHTFSHNITIADDTAIGNGTIGGKVAVNEGKSVHLFGETKIDSNNKGGDDFVAYKGLVEAGKTKIQALHRPLESQIGAPVYPGLMKELTVSEKEIVGTGRATSLATGLEIESTADLMIKNMTITANNKINVGEHTITLKDVTIKISDDVCQLVNGIYTIDLKSLINCDLEMQNVLLDASDLTLSKGFDPATTSVVFDFGDDVTIKQASGLDMRLGNYWSPSLNLDTKGQVIFTKLVETPEPTTGTLSLLALAALAARRRRK